jgi:hypothetical protein
MIEGVCRLIEMKWGRLIEISMERVFCMPLIDVTMVDMEDG